MRTSRFASMAAVAASLLTACPPDFSVPSDGAIKCTDQCPAPWTCYLGTCRPSDAPPPRCGDGVLDAEEQCDCGDGTVEPLPAGCLGPNSDTSPDHCRTFCRGPKCGDLVKDTGEQCDDGNDGCSPTCKVEVCGNGNPSNPLEQLDPGEACDDGNNVSGDGCSHDCRSREVCGNLIVDSQVGEHCDDGRRCSDGAPCECDLGAPSCTDSAQCEGQADPSCAPRAGDGCGATCRIEICGNGVRDPGEACDDGRQCGPERLDCTDDSSMCGDHPCLPQPRDGCSADCLSVESCGNAIIDTAVGEECDCGKTSLGLPDGCGAPNGEPASICTADCLARFCGNGDPQAPLEKLDDDEVCDDGNNVSGDGCSSDCRSRELCGNGLPDPKAGEECDDGSSCGPDGPACTCPEGRVDCLDSEACPGTPCAPQGDDGCSPTCTIEVCGNGDPEDPFERLDPREVCDDGDLESGDGCSADCLSDETCGNGYPDFAQTKEQCDDGGLRSRDGCSSACQVELARWAELEKSPADRLWPAMAYDARRRRTVAFGGERLSPLAGTWEYDGSAWVEVSTAGAPPARRDARMVYDSARSRMVLFGGSGGSYLGDTWELDGHRWTQVTTASSPTPRAGQAMAYDALRARTVLFGGRGAGGELGDTWEYDGADWAPVAGAGPSARFWGAMAFDAGRGRTLLHGGQDAAATYLADTWALTASGWARLHDGIGAAGIDLPSARSRHAMVYSSARAGVVLFGGYTNYEQADTWLFGTGWSTLPAAPTPPVRSMHGMAYDSGRGAVVVFGGLTYPGFVYGDTWEYADGASSWVEHFPPSERSPAARYRHAVAYDSGRGRAVLFGGDTGTSQDDTWEHDGRHWTLNKAAATGTPPVARREHAMTYDSVRGVTVLFGGYRGGTDPYPSQTWGYDGSKWSPKADVGAGPAGRAGHAMAFDPARGRAVLFGGQNAPGAYLGDLWEWDGSAWTERCDGVPAGDDCTVRPAPRRIPSLAFGRLPDGALSIVLYGGLDYSGNRFDDVWAWNGSAWKELDVDPALAEGRRSASLVFDDVRDRLILYGGTGGVPGGDVLYPEALELIPNPAPGPGKRALVWRPVPVSGFPPPARLYPAGVWDSWRGQALFFGGHDLGAVMGDTWRLRFESADDFEDCLDGSDNDGDAAIDCADPDCQTLPFCRSACADGSSEQDFGSGMHGCAGQAAFAAGASLCAPGVRLCTAVEWSGLRGATAPTHHYWTADALLLNGTAAACHGSVATGGAICPDSPMRVCAGATDPLGNTCGQWQGCGLEAATPSEFLGGCGNGDTAGALCCVR